MRILVGLDITHKSTLLILLTRLTWYYTQVHQLDITHKYMVLILLTRLTIQHHHLNHMRIHRNWYDSQVWLDINHKSREWILTLYNQQPVALILKNPNQYNVDCTTSRVILQTCERYQFGLVNHIKSYVSSYDWGGDVVL